MKAQISRGFGGKWLLVNSETGEYHGKEGVAIILFPETDEPSFLAAKRLCDAIPQEDELKGELKTIVSRIEKERQSIMEGH